MVKDNQMVICDSCGKTNNTVRVRACGYYSDVNNDPEHYETICDDCEHQHVMDI